MSTDEREFVLSHVFKDVSSMKENVYHYSPIKEYFGVPWKIDVTRKMDHLGMYLDCDQEKKDKEWSIEVWKEQGIRTVNGKTNSKASEVTFKNTDKTNGWGWHEFVKWEDMMKDYVVDDNLKVEIRAKIKKMTGVNLRNFGESKKQFSDVVLVVENQKFYVSKLFLASQSTHFKTVFLETYPTAPSLTLKDPTAVNFQKFLEILYGDAFIDESTVDAILSLSVSYDAQNPKRLCEEFLIEKSKKSLKEKWDLSTKHGLLSLKNHCLASMKTPADVASVIPSDLGQMDRSVLETLFRKAVSFK